VQGVKDWFYSDEVQVHVDREGVRCKRVVLQGRSLGSRGRR
jgi:hypothetical protein